MGHENFWLPKKESDERFREEVKDFDNSISSDGEILDKEYSHEKIPHELIPTVQILERAGVSLDDVHAWYASAISRRDREPLEAERFVSHFEGLSTDTTYAFGNMEKGFLLGYLKYGVFIPTHFAPKTMRCGYDLVKSLGESTNVPSVMSVTPDLSDTISKMPSWHILDVSFLSMFREELVGKKIVYNSHPDTKNLMLGLVSEYMEEADRWAEEGRLAEAV